MRGREIDRLAAAVEDLAGAVREAAVTIGEVLVASVPPRVEHSEPDVGVGAGIPSREDPPAASMPVAGVSPDPDAWAEGGLFDLERRSRSAHTLAAAADPDLIRDRERPGK